MPNRSAYVSAFLDKNFP